MKKKPEKKPKTIKDLASFILENRDKGKFIIDNDMWWFETIPELEDEDPAVLFESDEMVPWMDGYGGGCTYGGDILQALAYIVGVKTESV